MRKVVFGVAITVAIMLIFRYFEHQDVREDILKESSVLIQKQLDNVSKLVVTEGHFSEVFNYKNSKAIFGEYVTAEKKALVVVNAKVTVAYNLRALEYAIDEDTQTLEITTIPDYEVSIYPDLEYYDLQSDFLNPFEAEDYNAIKEKVKTSLHVKVEHSNLVSNAQNRLISELANFFVLTKSLGWTLVYQGTPILEQDNIKAILPSH